MTGFIVIVSVETILEEKEDVGSWDLQHRVESSIKGAVYSIWNLHLTDYMETQGS